MGLKYAAKLDLYRRMKGWSVKQLGERVGLTPKQMTYLLAGHHQPLGEVIVKLERNLDIRFYPEDFE